MTRVALSPGIRNAPQPPGSESRANGAATLCPPQPRFSGVKLLHALGLAVGIGAAIFVVTTALRHPAGLPALRWAPATVALLVCAITVAALPIVLGGTAWHLLLRASGVPSRWPVSVLTFSLAQYAKYIPGNVAQHFGRVALAKSAGYHVPTVIFTIIVETVLAIVSAAVLSFAALTLGRDTLIAGALAVVTPRETILALGIAAVVLLGVLAAVSYRGTARLRGLFGQGSVQRPQWRVLLGCLGLYALNLVLMGSCLLLLVHALYDARDLSFLLVVGVFSVAWTAGFLAPGAPAGLGVREAVLVATLGQVVAGYNIAGLALLLRLVTTAADTAVFVLAIVAKRRVLGSISSKGD